MRAMGGGGGWKSPSRRGERGSKRLESATFVWGERCTSSGGKARANGDSRRDRGDGEILFSGEPPFYIHPLSMAWKYMGLRKCFLRSQAECCSLLMSCRENGKVMSAFFS